MPILTNLARVDASFGTASMYDTSTVAVDIPSVKVDKTCDAVGGVWIGDTLTYTVTISNLDATIPAEEIEFTDTIDPSLARLVEDSVTVNNQALADGEFAYDPLTGKLDIPAGTYVMPDIQPGNSYTVTFQVTKV